MLTVLVAAVALVLVAPAHAENRTLSLYFTHTKESLKVVYKRNGAYVPSALRDLNRFLRDWRRNEATKMDPELFDLLWEVQQEFGGKTIAIVSAYRSPATNSMLRKRSRGVAKNSHHMAGKAIDFYIKGANMGRVRAAGMKRQVGGVGYYPRSGSPFVHFDTGRVRAWPRMNRTQLSRLFPDGKTMHLPTDGKPLKGYKEAQELEKAGKLQTLRGGSSLGVRSLFAFAGGGAGRSAERDDDTRGIVRPARATSSTEVAAADAPASRVRTTRVTAPQKKEEPKREPQRAEVRTASLGPATSTRRDEEGRGLFRQLPSVSLGGLIDRVRGDDEEPEVRTVAPPATPLTAVAREDDAIAEVQASETARAILSEPAAEGGTAVPVPLAAPRSSEDALPNTGIGDDDADAVIDGPVAVAALQPQTPDIVSDALGYARADGVDAGTSPLSATAALIPAPSATVRNVDPAAAPNLFAPAPTRSRQPVMQTAFAPVRGASPALIANHADLEDGGWDMNAPDRFGASAQGVLLANGFLGAPARIGDTPNWPSTDTFTGLKITVYARPGSGS